MDWFSLIVGAAIGLILGVAAGRRFSNGFGAGIITTILALFFIS